MHRNTILLINLALLLLVASGCATVTKGGTQSLTISTDPPGASCTMNREGALIGAVPQTPGTIQIDKDKDTITVSCKKEGFFESVAVLASEIQGMTFGNILLGGVIGVAVDGISGAMHQYPPMISITLTPEAFDSAETRDRFFNRRRTELLEEHTKTVESIRNNCGEEECDGQVRAAKELTDSRVALMEEKRTLARVRQ